MAAIGRVLLMDKGAYSGSTIYNQLDWVRDNGAAWVCKVDGTVGIAPPTLPTTSNANWTLMAQDGSVSGSVEWTSVNNKPFDDIDSTEFEKDLSNNLRLKNPNNFGTIKVDTHLLYASCANDTIEFVAGSNVTLTTDNVSNPNKITIASTGGGGGASSLDDLSDVTITSGTLAANQILKYNGSAWVNGSGGGHNMEPTPSSALTENTVVSTINTLVAQDGGESDDVASLFGIASWSNTMNKTYLVKGTRGWIGNGGIGTWPADIDNPTALEIATWIPIQALYGIGAVGKENIDIRIKYDPAKSGTIVLGGWVLSDNETMQDPEYPSDPTKTIPCGRIAIKFATDISDADKATAVVGIEISIKRTETVDVSTL